MRTKPGDANSPAASARPVPSSPFHEAIARGALLLLGGSVLGVALDILGTYDAQRIALFLVKGRLGDPIAELTRIFILTGRLNNFVVSPLVCFCVGILVGRLAKRWPHVTAAIACLPGLASELAAGWGRPRTITLTAVYLALAAITAQILFRARQQSTVQTTGPGTRKKRGSRAANT